MFKNNIVLRVLAMIMAAAMLALTPVSAFAAQKEGESYANWNDVADAMEDVFESAKAAYESGDAQGAYDAVNSGYFDYYEVLGFERNVKAIISGARKSEVELQFSRCKSDAKKGKSLDEFNKDVDALIQMIHEDANILDGLPADGGTDGAEASGDDTASASTGSGLGLNRKGTFIACFGIILREGFEAILIVGAIIAYLVKSGNKNKLRAVYLGSVLAIFASFAAAFALYALKLANGAQQEIIEGITALIAVLVLFYVSNWMVSKAEADAWSKYIEGQVSASVKTGSLFTLGFTAFLAVFREGAEVILFYQPLLADKSKIDMVWAGFGAGCVILVAVYLAIRFLSVKIPVKPFFLGTSILMFVMSISFLGGGIKELIEGDVLGMTSPDFLVALIPSNDFMEVLGIYPCLETLIPQLILLFVTLAIFVMQKWEKNKTEAGVIAILFGGLGLHKFYMGKYGTGIIYAALCWTFIPVLIAVMEGVHYLSESEEQFKKELA